MRRAYSTQVPYESSSVAGGPGYEHISAWWHACRRVLDFHNGLVIDRPRRSHRCLHTIDADAGECGCRCLDLRWPARYAHVPGDLYLELIGQVGCEDGDALPADD